MLIAITGGIGCGKSVVSQALRVMGYSVYDCDSRAKWVMTNDGILHQQLIDLFGAETYLNDGSLNKPHLSAAIFGNAEALNRMNACVHPAVARDLDTLYQAHIAQYGNLRPYFYESAILFESGFNHLSVPDKVWTVSAPLELRISRAMERDNTSRDKILSRINSQMSQDEKEKRADQIIWNDPQHSVLDQLNHLL